MSIKIKSKVLKASEYTHSLILFSDKFLENENFTSKIIYYTAKGILNLFSVSKLGDFLSGYVLQKVFKHRGIFEYWVKNKCQTKIIYNIPRYQLDTLIERCDKGNIPTYQDIDFKTKECVGLYIGPYWTNKLYYVLDNRIIQEKFESDLDIKNDDKNM